MTKRKRKPKDENEEAFVNYVCDFLDSIPPEQLEAQEKWLREMENRQLYGYRLTPEDWEKFRGMFGLGRDKYMS